MKCLYFVGATAASERLISWMKVDAHSAFPDRRALIRDGGCLPLSLGDASNRGLQASNDGLILKFCFGHCRVGCCGVRTAHITGLLGWWRFRLNGVPEDNERFGRNDGDTSLQNLHFATAIDLDVHHLRRVAQDLAELQLSCVFAMYDTNTRTHGEFFTLLAPFSVLGWGLGLTRSGVGGCVEFKTGAASAVACGDDVVVNAFLHPPKGGGLLVWRKFICALTTHAIARRSSA